MNLQYDEIFELRGGSYHEAMRAYPLARAAEFARAFDRAPVTSGETILDVPSGGGYLSRFLPQARITALELTAGFGADIPVVSANEDWPVGRFDRIVCAAALHHLDDQAPFIERMLRHLKPNGILHILDVGTGSPVGRFLDEFIGRYNGTGHAGCYLPADLASLGFAGEVTFYEEVACPWTFESRADLVTFCYGLFGLSGCTRVALEEALHYYIGIEEEPRGAVGLNWRLHYADVRQETADAAGRTLAA